MATVYINDTPLEIGDDERINGIQAAQRLGVEIPHYCWHAGLSVVASCRMCLCESGTRDAESGEVKMIPKLVPACQTPARDGSVFVTDSEKVQQARAMVEEDLLIDHPIDCPICDKAGECYLQDYHFKYGQDQRRADLRPFTSRRRPMGDTVTLFVDRCVMCTRCVRFCREVSGTSELMVINRGAQEEIDVFPGFPLENKLAGNVVDLCPVGALGDRNFLYSQRVWFMESHDGVCTRCATGCSIHVDENQDRVYRVRPRENRHINEWWMCDDGRYGWDHVHDQARLKGPLLFDEEAETHILADWTALPDQIHQRLVNAAERGKLAAVLSPHLTVEEAWMLAEYIRQLDAEADLCLGAVPNVGEDESFPNGFTIRSEKAPNRRGVEEVVAAFGGGTRSWEEVQQGAAAGDYEAVWLSGGYPEGGVWNDAVAANFSETPTLIVQDLFASPVSERAHIVLPAAAFAEREGSYVNATERLQTVPWAVRAPAGVMSEGRLLWRLLQKPGLYQAATILRGLAIETPYFAAAQGEIPLTGIDLRIPLLAESNRENEPAPA